MVKTLVDVEGNSPFYIKYKRSLSYSLSFLFLYSMLGFFAVPWFVERTLIKTLDERLDIQSSVAKVRFNPFTFKLSVSDLDLREGNESPVLSIAEASANFQPSRLVLFKVSFSELTLTEVVLHLARYSASENTVTELSERWIASAEAEENEPEENNDDEEGGLFPLEINSFIFSQGSFHYTDQVPETEFQTSLSNINLELINFSTLENVAGEAKLDITLEDDGSIATSNTFTINPLNTEGVFTLDNFSLTSPYRYLQDDLPFQLEDGRFALEFSYLFSQGTDDFTVSLEGIQAEISDLFASVESGTEPFISEGRVSLSAGQLMIPENSLSIDSINVSGLKLRLERDEQGDLDWLTMMSDLQADKSESVAASSTSSESEGKPWQVMLNSFTVNDTEFLLSDRFLETDASTALEINMQLTDFNSEEGSSMPFNSTLLVQSGGQIKVEGALEILPELKISSQLEVSDLLIVAAEPYLNDFAEIGIESGTLSLQSNLSVSSADPFSLEADVALNKVILLDNLKDETLFSLTSLAVDSLAYSQLSNSLTISEIELDEPFVRVLINEEGRSNIGETLKSKNSENELELVETRTEDSNSELTISLGQLTVSNAQSHFTDHNLPIVFNTEMNSLEGQFTGFSSTSSLPMEVTLEGQVDEFGLVLINGKLNPLDITQLTNIDLSFTNLDLSHMSPYVIKFAGREIADGRVDVDLSYDITNKALDASNSVVLRDLLLGDKVEHLDAMDLPLDLAIALLKDGNGVIDLEVPISGNVDDPEFSFGPVIRRAITNVLASIVTAPFKLLGNLIGGASEDFDNIRFLPGRSDIAPPEQEKLLALVSALTQRPQLSLTIPSTVAPEADLLALKTLAFDESLQVILEAGEGAEESLNENLLASREAALIDLYGSAQLLPSLEALRIEYTKNSEETDSGEQSPQFDSLAFAAHLRESLIIVEEISSQDLQNLGQERANGIKGFILNNSELNESQLETPLESEYNTELDDDGWLALEFDVGVVKD